MLSIVVIARHVAVVLNVVLGYSTLYNLSCLLTKVESIVQSILLNQCKVLLLGLCHAVHGSTQQEC